jgi:hypothetical protein
MKSFCLLYKNKDKSYRFLNIRILNYNKRWIKFKMIINKLLKKITIFWIKINIIHNKFMNLISKNH